MEGVAKTFPFLSTWSRPGHARISRRGKVADLRARQIATFDWIAAFERSKRCSGAEQCQFMKKAERRSYCGT
jgi:hypothetical protein